MSESKQLLGDTKPGLKDVATRGALQVAGTAFVVLFCIVGLALWGLPFYYDFMVQQLGWTRAQVTSGNALSKLVVGPVFGFIAGWIIDRFGPRRVMMAGILTAGGVAEAVSPWLTGRLRDTTGDYSNSFLLVGVALLGAAVLRLPAERNAA